MITNWGGLNDTFENKITKNSKGLCLGMHVNVIKNKIKDKLCLYLVYQINHDNSTKF